MSDEYVVMPKADWEAILDAMRAKEGSSAGILAGELAAKIAAISSGIDTSDANAIAADMRNGKTAYVNGKKITGTVAERGSANVTASGSTVKVPAGIYDSDVSKSVSAATQATPSISVNSSGLITASATQSAGYVSSGTKSATKQLTTKGATTYTPSTSNQTIPSGTYLTGAQTIKGDSNLLAENIAKGVSIFGVAGTYGGGKQTLLTTYATQNSDLYTCEYSISFSCPFNPSFVLYFKRDGFDWESYNSVDMVKMIILEKEPFYFFNSGSVTYPFIAMEYTTKYPNGFMNTSYTTINFSYVNNIFTLTLDESRGSGFQPANVFVILAIE